MRKTKADMEKEIDFLKLQLSNIAKLAESTTGMDVHKLYKTIGAIIYHASEYQGMLDYIQQNNLPYDFYNQSMKG